MARLKIGIWIILVLLIAACSAGPPQVTPTVAPTKTPDLTRIAASATHTPTFVAQLVASATPTATSTLTPTLTVTPSPTDTLTATITPTGTLTPSHTPSLTPTLTNTVTPTATFTLTPSHTPTLTPVPSDTATATVTPLILADTDTPTFTATFTPIPSITPSQTPTPTQTFTVTPLPSNTPNLVATSNTELLQTRAAASDTPAPATFTPVRQASPTNTLATLDATPTFVTAAANITIVATPDIVIEFPTSEAQITPEISQNAVPATATFSSFTPTPFPIAQIPPTVVVQARPNIVVDAPVFSNSNTSAITFNVGAGNFIFNGEALSGDVRLFATNPFDPSSYARTNNAGLLILRPIGGSEGTLTGNPFFEGFTAESAESNKNFISELSWSPNGQRLAFVIQPAPGTADTGNAGVWFWDAGSNASYVLIHDCPNDGYSSCALSNHPVGHWQSMNVEWSPNSAQVVITAWLPDENRQGIFISQMHYDTRRPEAPHFERWENGHWLNNQQILVSGIAPDGRSLIAIYNLVLGGVEDVLFDASANGLYIFDAVQRSNGQIIALGREGGRGGALRLYRIENGVATPLSAYIGDSHPQRVQWSLGFGQAVLTINGGQYMVSTSDGTIRQATVSGSVVIGGGVSEEGQLLGPPPSGVVINSRYTAGQQVQYIGDIPRNMRVQPNTFAAWVDVINPNEFVTVLAGPYEANGYEWWEVSNARNNRAWTSTHTLDGFSFFSP